MASETMKQRVKAKVAKKLKCRVLNAIDALQSIDRQVCSEEGDGACGIDATDVSYVVETLTEMAQEYEQLMHYLEVTSLNRMKYQCQMQGMAREFRRTQKENEIAIKRQGLNKLKAAFERAKVVRKALLSKKMEVEELQKTNARLKIQAEEVADDTEALKKQLHDYYDRQTQAKDAIDNVKQSISRKKSEVNRIQIKIQEDKEAWDDERLELHRIMYEILRATEYEEQLIDDGLNAGAEDSAEAMQASLRNLADEIEELKKEYAKVMSVIETQIQEQRDEEASRKDLETWALQGETNTATESELELMGSMSDFDELHDDPSGSLGTDADDGTFSHDPKAKKGILEGLDRLFDHSGPSGHLSDKSEWETIIGTFDSLEELQAKIKSLLEEESHLANETQRMKRAISAKTRKLEKLKKVVLEANEDATRLQHQCDEVQNKLDEVAEQEVQLKEESEEQLTKLESDINVQIDRSLATKKEHRDIELGLAEFSATTNVEILDLEDDILNTTEEVAMLHEEVHVEQTKFDVLLKEVECHRAEKDMQQDLRVQINTARKELEKRLVVLEKTSKELIKELTDQIDSARSVYEFHTRHHGEMAIACAELDEAVEEAKEELKVWKKAVLDGELKAGDLRRKMDTIQLDMEVYSTQLNSDLIDLHKAFIGYEVMGKICQNYVPYVKSQTALAAKKADQLLVSVENAVNQRPILEEELRQEREFVRRSTESGELLELSSPKQCGDLLKYLEAVEKQLGDLQETLPKIHKEIKLIRKQGDMMDRIVDGYAYHLLRDQAHLFCDPDNGSGDNTKD